MNEPRSQAIHALGKRVACTDVTEHAELDPTGLDITHHEVDGILVLTVTGEIDMNNASALRDAVNDGIDRTQGEPCILDLTTVTFLGSAGLTALLQATTHARQRREPLRIVVDHNRPVIRPIQVTGLDNVLSLYHSVDEATQTGTRQ
jgi:anti-sigma B factor antagonist